MDDLAVKSIKSQQEGLVNFVPTRFEKIFLD